MPQCDDLVQKARLKMLREAQVALARQYGLDDDALTLTEMGELLRLRGRDVGSSMRDLLSGKDHISGPMALAVEALMSGWTPANLPELLASWGWEDVA